MEDTCVDTEKSLCKNGCVNTALFDWCTHRFCALIHGFLVLCKAVSRVLFWLRKLLVE